MAKTKNNQGSGVKSAAIEQISTASLIPYARNARTHSEQQVKQIAGSIQEFGFCNPVLIDATNGIIAGHGRVMAAQLLKLESVPCLRLSHLTDAQKRAYVLADNRIALSSGWDEEMLANELSDLHADEFDMALLGFDADELAGLLKLNGDELPADPSGEVVEDEVPEPPADPITKPGNLWILGEHRLLCGDSTKAEDVGRLMAGAKVDCVLTDPPYGIGYAGSMKLGQEKFGWKQYVGGWDELRPTDEQILFISRFAKQVIIWGGNFFPCLPVSAGWLVWNKVQRNFSMGEGELAWTNFKNSVRMFDLSRGECISDGKEHPTQKSVKLISWCLGFMDGSIVADFYLGSGTTLIAAEQLNRKCYGMEISPAYCDVIVKRWENLTGKKAVLEAA